jgi:predicted glycoside hydrolase/deacetylase ChbG (UPF0249 family)
MDVIINADDLGISSKVNRSIFDLMRQELVTSATLIANAPEVEEATKGIGRFPNCTFGAHLNITEFSPLTGPQDLKPILNENGTFERDLVRRVSVDSRLSNGIFAEWCAQIERLIHLGVNLSHIDSHQHVHTIPKMFLLLKKLQKKYGISRVRISRNIYGSYEGVSASLRAKKGIYNFLLKNYKRTKTTQGFTDLKAFCELGSSRELSYKNVEIMVHPGLDGYDDGTDLLSGPWLQGLKFPVKLINYTDLD